MSGIMKNHSHEQQIYDFITVYLAQNRYSPSISEIADYTGTSIGNTWRYPQIMRTRGLVDWQYKRPRTLQVIAPFK